METTKPYNALHWAAGFENQGSSKSAFIIIPLADFERLYIEMVLEFFDGHVPKAAKALNIAASTLYRKQQSWNIAR